jgi:ADP-heptose:LPS heptosyltransferase
MISPKNLLIVRTDRIGDVVLTLPLAALMKKKHPGCKVSFLIREYTLPLLQGNPFIDDILLLDMDKSGKGKSAVLKAIRKKKFDSCVIVSPNFEITKLIYRARIPLRIGTGYRWYSFLFNERIYEHRKYGEKHELEYNIDLLNIFGLDSERDRDHISFDIKIPEASAGNIPALLEKKGIPAGNDIIILHPGSGGSAVDLPPEKFRLLAGLLSELENITVVITGSAAEKELADTVKGSSKAVSLAGELSLHDLMALIRRSRILAANSTGPLHIAAALGIYTIGFFPKIPSCSAKRWGPYTSNKMVYTPQIDCSNCTREQCERLDCMNSINIQDVFANIKNILNLP